MICILAGNYLEAKRWAEGQLLNEDEWFFPSDIDHLMGVKGFHVIVVGTAGMNVPPSYFEKVLSTAKEQGRRK